VTSRRTGLEFGRDLLFLGQPAVEGLDASSFGQGVVVVGWRPVRWW